MSRNHKIELSKLKAITVYSLLSLIIYHTHASAVVSQLGCARGRAGPVADWLPGKTSWDWTLRPGLLWKLEVGGIRVPDSRMSAKLGGGGCCAKCVWAGDLDGKLPLYRSARIGMELLGCVLVGDGLQCLKRCWGGPKEKGSTFSILTHQLIRIRTQRLRCRLNLIIGKCHGTYIYLVRRRGNFVGKAWRSVSKIILGPNLANATFPADVIWSFIDWLWFCSLKYVAYRLKLIWDQKAYTCCTLVAQNS